MMLIAHYDGTRSLAHYAPSRCRVNQSPGGVDPSIWGDSRTYRVPLRDLRLSFLMVDEELQGEEGGGNRKDAEGFGLLCREKPERIPLGTPYHRGPHESTFRPPPVVGSSRGPLRS